MTPMEAIRNHFFGRAVTMAMMSGSGGIGKNELSANDRPPRAFSAEGFSAQPTTQLYMRRIRFLNHVMPLRSQSTGFVSRKRLNRGPNFDRVSLVIPTILALLWAFWYN